MTLNILGTPYTVTVKKYDEDEVFAERGIDGYCSFIDKQIVVCDLTTYKGYEKESKEYCEVGQRHTLRHEIVHAFFNESGLMESALVLNGSWARNEEMVDWFATQGQKIQMAWKEAGALDA